MIQTGQRLGMSLGTAVAATLFFGTLTSLRGAYADAASRSLLGAAAMVGVALVIGHGYPQSQLSSARVIHSHTGIIGRETLEFDIIV